MAQQVILKAAFVYIASGAEDTFTLRENIRAFNHKLIVPPYALWMLKIQVQRLNLQVKIIFTNYYGTCLRLINQVNGGEVLLRGVHEFGSLYTTSSYSTVDLPEITEALQRTPHWFQFYLVRMTGLIAISMDREG